MSYQIVKGWPADSAIDEELTPETGAAIIDGCVASLKTVTGQINLASYAATGTNNEETPFFIIDKETLRGKKMGLKGLFVIEADAAHFSAAIGTYAINQKLSAQNGKFAAITGTEKPLAKVIAKDVAKGLIRLLWIAVD